MGMLGNLKTQEKTLCCKGRTHMCPDQPQDVLVAWTILVFAVPRQHGMQQLIAVVLQPHQRAYPCGTD